uniref:Uncharacterized protein n=1 Tax=viral metagenome TaxID=1070528 RepID=A0A6M3LFS4_9ZZZZ
MKTIDLLNNKNNMDDFIHNLSHYNMDNMTGGSYRKVRLCYYENNILLVSEHHTQKYCSIYIVDNPNTNFKVYRGCQDSCYDGNPFPKIKGANFICVWSNGTWNMNGPWQEKIENMLDDLIIRLENKKIEVAKEKEDNRLKLQKEQEMTDKELAENWK